MSGSMDTCVPSFVSNFGSRLILQSIRKSALCTRKEKRDTRTDVCVIFFTQLKHVGMCCNMKHCCNLGNSSIWNGRSLQSMHSWAQQKGWETFTGIFEEAQMASKVCVYFDPPKTDELRTRLSIEKFGSARLWKMCCWRCTHPCLHLDTPWWV